MTEKLAMLDKELRSLDGGLMNINAHNCKDSFR